MCINLAPTDLVAARLGEKRLSETRQQRTDHEHRPAERRATPHEILRRDIVCIDIVGLEQIVAFASALHLHSHTLKQSDKIAHIEYLRDVCDMNLFRRKQTSAYDLKRLVFGSLWFDLSGKPVAALNYKSAHLWFVLG